MDRNELWLKFIISGDPKDYIRYQNCKREGFSFENGNRRISNKGNEHRGSRQADNNSYKG